jgi:hypothetical protein
MARSFFVLLAIGLAPVLEKKAGRIYLVTTSATQVKPQLASGADDDDRGDGRDGSPFLIFTPLWPERELSHGSINRGARWFALAPPLRTQAE